MILIKDAEIVDGTGKAPFRGDVLVKDDKISAIGRIPRKSAPLVLDGAGMYLMPGFIDVNTDSDHYLTLFTNPTQKSFLLQGVTTIIGGQCGSSLAPLLYGSLESIRKWTDINQVNVDWHSVREFFGVMERRSIGVNFGTLVGHSTVRRALIGETFRDLTVNELSVMRRVFEEALLDGAFGISTGLGYAHSRETPYGEIKTLVELVAKHNAVYTTHLRDEREGLLASVSETIRIAEETQAKTVISHFRPLLGFEKDFLFCVDLIRNAPSAANVRFDNYPFPTSIIPIYVLLPRWVQNGGLEIMLANLRTPYLEERILKELPVFAPEDIVVLEAPGAEYLVGKSLGEFAKGRELDLEKGLLELMRVSNLRAVVLHQNINVDLVIKTLTHPKGFVASNSPGRDEPHGIGGMGDRAFSTFTRFLSLVQSQNFMPIEEAVKKITSAPAHFLGLRERGEIREGMMADLTMVRGSEVVNVFLNGELAVRDGQLQPLFAGKILRRT